MEAGRDVLIVYDDLTAGDDDYLDCIPLTGMVAIEPSGYVELPSGSGNKFWSTAYGPNAGDDGMDEHTYMYNNGWNPQLNYGI